MLSHSGPGCVPRLSVRYLCAVDCLVTSSALSKEWSSTSLTPTWALSSSWPTCVCVRVSHRGLLGGHHRLGRPPLPGYLRVDCLFVGCLTSQQHASVSQGQICSDNSTCCHTETEVADQTFYLTQSQYTDTGPTSPSADPTGTWQGSHWSADFEVTGMTRPGKSPGASGIRTPDLPLRRRTP